MFTSHWKLIAKGLLAAGLIAGLGMLFLSNSTPTAASELPTAQPQFNFASFLPFVRLPKIKLPFDIYTATPSGTVTPGDPPTRTPTSTPSSHTPTPTPTNHTPTPTRTPTVTTTAMATATQAPPGTVHMPYGPFHNSDFNRDFFDGSFNTDWNSLPTIRSQGYQVFGAAAISDPCVYMPSGADSFDSEAVIADIIARRDTILDYASDDTLLGLMELNEPHDPSSCEDVPVYKLEQVAAGFWAAFPELSPATFYFGFGSPPTYFEDGGGVPSANLAFYQFSANDGAIEDDALPQQESAARQGMKLIYSVNLFTLGLDAALAANTWECQQTDGLLVTLWTDRYVSDADAGAYALVLATCDAAAP